MSVDREQLKQIANFPEKVGMGVGVFGVVAAAFFPPAMALALPATGLLIASAVSHEVTGSIIDGTSSE